MIHHPGPAPDCPIPTNMKFSTNTILLAVAFTLSLTACETDATVFDGPSATAISTPKSTEVAHGEETSKVKIRGRITNQNGSAVPDATVIFDGITDYQISTDVNGEYEIDPMDAETYTVSVSHQAYSTHNEVMVVSTNATLDFELQP